MKGKNILKTTLLITALIASLVTVGSSLAVPVVDLSDGKQIRVKPSLSLSLVATVVAEKEDIEHLLQKLNDPDPFVRVEAVQGLGEIHKVQSLVSVSKRLLDNDIYVRAFAAEALGKLGRIDISLTLSKLLPALSDPSSYVRAMIVAALVELKHAKATDALRQLTHDKDETVRGMAEWYLNQIATSQSTSIFSSSLDYDCIGRY